MKVSELGEFKLIELLSKIVPKGETDPQIVVGIGDDAAAWRANGFTLLATTDTLVQGVHFTAESTWREIGWKAVAINLSDIATMGGTPKYALVSLSLPGDTELDEVTQLYQGIAEIARQFQIAIVGGNISSAPLVVITITVIGKAQTEGILTRSAALPGDLIAVTGYLGSSAAGLRILAYHLQFDPETVAFLRKAHLQPEPRVSEGQLLVRKGVRAAIDISDGLMSDLQHICQASKVGAIIKIDQLPIHPTVRATFPQDSLNLALAGGEDYELLFTAPKKVINRVKRATDYPVTVIGEIVEESRGITLIDKEGKPFQANDKGWEHFISQNY